MPIFFRRPRRTVPSPQPPSQPPSQPQPHSQSNPLTNTTTTTNHNNNVSSHPIELHLRPSSDALALLLSQPLRHSSDVRVARRHTLSSGSIKRASGGRIGIGRRQLQIRGDYLLIIQQSQSQQQHQHQHQNLSTLRKLSHFGSSRLRSRMGLNADQPVVHMVMRLPTRTQWMNCMTNDLTYTFLPSGFVTPVFNTANNNNINTANNVGAQIQTQSQTQTQSPSLTLMPTTPPFTRLTFTSSSAYADFLSKLPLSLSSSSSSPLSPSSSNLLPQNNNTHTHLPLLGHGATSQVRLLPSTQHAVKLLCKSEIFDSSTALNQLVAERLSMQTLSGIPYILCFKGAYQTASHFALVTELAELGDLHDVVTRCGRFEERVAKQIFAEIVLALAMVHRNGLLYRDLKLGNVLLTKQGRVRLADFGLVKEVPTYARNKKRVVVSDGDVEGERSGRMQTQQEKKGRRSSEMEGKMKKKKGFNNNKKGYSHHGTGKHINDDQDDDDDIRDSSASTSSAASSSISVSTRETKDDYDVDTNIKKKQSLSIKTTKQQQQNSDDDDDDDDDDEEDECILGRASSFVGTRRYMSPELCAASNGGRSYGAPSDVWALGIVLYVLLTGRYPFSVGNGTASEHDDDEAGNCTDLFHAIQNDNVTMPGYLSDEAKKLLQGLLTRDALDRIDLKTVRRHEWLSSVDWDRLRVDAHGVNQSVVDFVEEKGNDEEEREKGRGRGRSGKKRKDSGWTIKDWDRMLAEEEEGVVDMRFSFDHVIGFDMVAEPSLPL